MKKVVFVSLFIALFFPRICFYERRCCRDNNLAMGNPSNAKTTPASADNYLLEKEQYSVSYNAARGIANWVS